VLQRRFFDKSGPGTLQAGISCHDARADSGMDGGFNYLLRFLGPARLGLWTLSEPVMATLLAWPLFHEVPSVQVIAGGVMALVGVGLGVRGAAQALCRQPGSSSRPTLTQGIAVPCKN
jgi:hypothetical protein